MIGNYKHSLFPEFHQEEESYPGWYSDYESFLKHQLDLSKKPLRCFYGFSKLTKKIVRKRSIVCFFENDYSFKNEEWINRRIHVAFVREQNYKEKQDAAYLNRIFTKYEKFIDEKPYKGKFEWALQDFMKDESKNVSEEMKLEISEALKKKYININY